MVFPTSLRRNRKRGVRNRLIRLTLKAFARISRRHSERLAALRLQRTEDQPTLLHSLQNQEGPHTAVLNKCRSVPTNLPSLFASVATVSVRAWPPRVVARFSPLAALAAVAGFLPKAVQAREQNRAEEH